MGLVEEAVAAVQAGQPVVLPFDTVYGLATTPYREEPVFRAYRLKGRPETQAAAIAASGVDELVECVPELRGRSEQVARALLPGPYTLVLPNPARRFRWLTGLHPESIGVRVPTLTGEAKEVLDRLGCVMQTSANRHGGPDARRLQDVPAEILAGCGAALDGGDLPGTPSTVVDCTGPEPRILREGAGDPAAALALLSRQ